MRFVKIGVVVIGAVVLTALGIDAADTLDGKSGTLLSRVINIQSTEGPCPSGMTYVEGGITFSCIDTYEASVGDSCPRENPSNPLETQENVDTKDCRSESRERATPWRFITREQAMNMCALSGKRLPTAEEWYRASMGYVRADAVCNVDSGSPSKTGEYPECVSSLGVYDQVGNIWEWVADDVIEGQFNDRTLPEGGYVAQVDSAGVATKTNELEQILFGKDYFWSNADGANGVLRGGYYSSGPDAGVYAVHAGSPPTSVGTAIGFRCVK